MVRVYVYIFIWYDVTRGATFTAKVIIVEEPTGVTTKEGKVLRKQDTNIADSSGNARLLPWENNVESLQLNKSYSFTNIGVREYSDTKFLCLSSSLQQRK